MNLASLAWISSRYDAGPALLRSEKMILFSRVMRADKSRISGLCERVESVACVDTGSASGLGSSLDGEKLSVRREA